MALCKTGRASAKRPSSVDTHAGEPMRVIAGFNTYVLDPSDPIPGGIQGG